MTHIILADQPQARRAIRALSLPALVRLVTEIDDNGPISRRRGSLQSAFDDLSAHQLRHAIDRAREFGLVYGDEDERVRYRLTDRGEELAEVYDTAARWARAHQFPTAATDFVTRVQHTLDLLSHTEALAHATARSGDASGMLTPGGAVLGRDAIVALDGPQSALGAWLKSHAYALHHTALHSSLAADEWEIAA
ncbi:regulator [Streptomyces sp. NPDC048416]|uniref:regulator n=1 Tax=Streptomyces sp. NPDC048416 TaxID=3365546 RepID=UPI0037176F9E